MCGINGIFAYHRAAGQPTQAELLKTRERMHARGPDSEGLWWDLSRRCGLAHRRLSILDLSENGAQPMLSDSGDLAVIFNGEIYNYPLLRKTLEAEGVRFRTNADTEVLLHLYSRHGTEMVQALRGMFAFAIWDERKHGLFLARDPYGIKPLYTSSDGWTFRFASQVKALLAGNQVSRDPEPAGIVGFHLFGSVPEPFTCYRDIRALPAGHIQWIDSSGPSEPRSYETISAILARGANEPAPALELNDRVRAGSLDSVKAHLLADVEVGIFLSSGVDSGALLGLMCDAGQKDIRAITLAFDEFTGTSEDEAPIARRLAEHYGAQHVLRRVSAKEFDSDLPLIFDAMDQPSIDGINTWFVAKAAKEAGLKVAISGLGGDELLAGYPSFVDIPRWRRRFGPLAMVPGLGRLVRGVAGVFARKLTEIHPKALGLFKYSDSWSGAYLLRRGLFLPEELTNILGRDFVHEGLRRLDPMRYLSASMSPDPGSPVARVCALESSNYLRNQLLRDADWAGMAHSIEIRVPFVDVSLLKALAPSIRTLGVGLGKAALAQAPSNRLPDEIVTRAKTGFNVPIGTWIAKTAVRKSKGSSAVEPKGNISRRWSGVVLDKFNIVPHATIETPFPRYGKNLAVGAVCRK
jgi:asparagine synthase (glutamine-hydrolysing)